MIEEWCGIHLESLRSGEKCVCNACGMVWNDVELVWKGLGMIVEWCGMHVCVACGTLVE